MIRNELPFATVPEWLLDSDTSDRAVRLYGVLVRYADKEGHAHPSRRLLAERLRCSVDSVDRALRDLIAIGALEVEDRSRDDGSQTSNDYVLRPGGRKVAAGGGRTTAAPRGGTAAAPKNESQKNESQIERETNLAARRGREHPGFAEWYEAYPRHVHRRAAEKAYRAALKRTGPVTLLRGAERLTEDPNLPEKEFIPHPATWLNADGWLDEPYPNRNGKSNDVGSDAWVKRMLARRA